MEKENSATQKLAAIIKRLESSGHKVSDMSDKIKAIGFVGGISAHQKSDQPSVGQDVDTDTAPG